MIEFCNVKLGYIKEFYSLYNINLKIDNGEKVALFGEQDAGKTCFLRLLAKLDNVSSGNIYYNDVPLENIDYSQELSVGYVANKPILINSTVQKNIEYVFKIRKVLNTEREKLLANILEKFSLVELKNSKIKNLPLYQRRLLQFAMLSIRDKIDILLLDDIFDGLNEKERQNIEDILMHFMKKNTTVFFATRNLDDAKKFCDKIVFIKLGAIEKVENNKLKLNN